MNILAALLLFCAADLPTATIWGSGNPESWFSSNGRFKYPLWIEYPFSFRLDGILTNYVTNVVSSIDRDPETKCPICGGKSHHLYQERTIEITPQFTLRIVTAGKDGVSLTNDVLLAKGEPVTRKETNLVERPQFTYGNLVITNYVWPREWTNVLLNAQ